MALVSKQLDALTDKLVATAQAKGQEFLLGLLQELQLGFLSPLVDALSQARASRD